MTKKEIIDFISKQRTSIISSVDENGYPATRALIQPVLVEGNVIYFATYTSSRKVRHYLNNPKACVYFYSKGQTFQGAEIKGEMQVLTDQTTKSTFWKPFFSRFYKKGVTDPDYCILKFTGVEAQWFSNFRTETVKF